MIEWRDVALILGPALAYAATRFTGRKSVEAARTTATLSKEADDAATEVERERLGLDTLQRSLEEQERRIERMGIDLAAAVEGRRVAEERASAAELRAAASDQRASQAAERAGAAERRAAQLELRVEHLEAERVLGNFEQPDL